MDDMIYTGYYAKLDEYCKLGFTKERLLAISNTVPDYFRNKVRHFKKISPRWELIKEHKDNKINDNQFVLYYYKHLDNIKNYIDWIIRFLSKPCIFLCYETPDKFCHRKIFAKYLINNYSVVVEEINLLEMDKLKNKSEHITEVDS